MNSQDLFTNAEKQNLTPRVAHNPANYQGWQHAEKSSNNFVDSITLIACAIGFGVLIGLMIAGVVK